MKIYKQFFADIKRYKSYMICAAKSELKTEVADSYLNWIWWVLEPFCLMLVYTFIFGIIFVITAIDINRVKKIAEMGGFSSDTNLAIYCAYTLYVDFINIFLRVLYYVMVSKSRKDKN